MTLRHRQLISFLNAWGAIELDDFWDILKRPERFTTAVTFRRTAVSVDFDDPSSLLKLEENSSDRRPLSDNLRPSRRNLKSPPGGLRCC